MKRLWRSVIVLALCLAAVIALRLYLRGFLFHEGAATTGQRGVDVVTPDDGQLSKNLETRPNGKKPRI
jgi:hypothetical protein